MALENIMYYDPERDKKHMRIYLWNEVRPEIILEFKKKFRKQRQIVRLSIIDLRNFPDSEKALGTFVMEWRRYKLNREYVLSINDYFRKLIKDY